MVRFLLVQIKPVQFLPAKFDAVQQCAKSALQGFHTVRGEPLHRYSEHERNGEELGNAIDIHAVEVGDENEDIGQNDNAPYREK